MAESNWDQRYREGQFPGYEPLELLLDAIRDVPPGTALDLACGAGRHAVYLAKHGWQVTAVDASTPGLELARAYAKSQGVTVGWHLADLERQEFVIEPAAFDLVCVIQYLQRDLIPALRAAVRPGGLVVAHIAMVDDAPDVKPMNPAFLLQPGELRGQFAGWEVLRDTEQRSATGHKRLTAEFVARAR